MQRLNRILVFTALLAMTASAAWCQSAPVVTEQDFAVLHQWKNAVLAGDSAGLLQSYSTDPAAQVTTAKGNLNADAEVRFWIGLKARALKLKIVQTNKPRPDIQVVGFQAEVQSGAASPQTVYVSEAQVWQKQGEQWKLVAAKRTDATHLEQPIAGNKNIYPPDVDARAEIKQAQQNAAKEHKRVLLVFGANWCYDCHVLDLAFQRADFASVIAGYEVVHVDIG
jgi:uncharacterized protein YchJ